MRATILVLTCLLAVPTNGGDQSAAVHLKTIVAASGDDLDDLGPAKVTMFKSETDERDFAKRFRDNRASDIPYGVYRLRVHHDGFYSAERQVVVSQPIVWVVVGLEIGGIGSDARNFEVAGTVRNIPRAGEPLWVRLAGVHSTLARDAKVDESGNFVIAGLRQDKAVLIVWSGREILHVTQVVIPTHVPLVIDLEQKAGR